MCLVQYRYSLRKKKNKFCSQSCSAKKSNLTRRRVCHRADCDNFIGPKANKFCSYSCNKLHDRGIYVDKWLRGEVNGGGKNGNLSKHVRNYLLNKANFKCTHTNCGWDWSKPCIVEVDHIDGNSQDNSPENLRIICPNCHTQTKTYKGRNRGNGRSHRRIRYANGESF